MSSEWTVRMKFSRIKTKSGCTVMVSFFMVTEGSMIPSSVS